MHGITATRQDLIRDVWPDKMLYAATLVAITSLLGALQGLAFLLVEFRFDYERVPRLLVPSAPGLLALSSAGAVLALLGLRRQSLPIISAAAVAALAGRSLLGVGSVLAFVAGVFLLLAWREGEHAQDPASRLLPEDWPDKTLAASAVLLVASALTTAWGLALALDRIVFSGFGLSLGAFSALAIATGLLGVVASILLQRQRLPWLASVAAVLLVPSLGLYVVAPVLAVTGLVLLRMAKREGEFD